MIGITAAKYQGPDFFEEGPANRLVNIWWGAEEDPATETMLQTMMIGHSGNDITISGKQGGANLPPTGTEVSVWGGNRMCQNYDDDVASTALMRGNRKAVGNGWGAQEGLDGHVSPDSLVFPGGRPSHLGDDLPWPIDPANPPDDSFGHAVNFGGVLALTGYPPGESLSPPPPDPAALIPGLRSARAPRFAIPRME